MKKLIVQMSVAAFLAGGMVMGTGCGGPEEDPNAAQNEAEEEFDEDVDPDEEETIQEEK
tara:strand:+ start:400 stop:576 length:177 start_codon:yes stop_codon:yes gene_type:complete